MDQPASSRLAVSVRFIFAAGTLSLVIGHEGLTSFRENLCSASVRRFAILARRYAAASFDCKSR
jgi:hypothetical protein